MFKKTFRRTLQISLILVFLVAVFTSIQSLINPPIGTALETAENGNFPSFTICPLSYHRKEDMLTRYSNKTFKGKYI